MVSKKKFFLKNIAAKATNDTISFNSFTTK